MPMKTHSCMNNDLNRGFLIVQAEGEIMSLARPIYRPGASGESVLNLPGGTMIITDLGTLILIRELPEFLRI
jgi:hypothetical protein